MVAGHQVHCHCNAGTDGAPELIHLDELKGGDLRKAMQTVTERRAYLLER